MTGPWTDTIVMIFKDCVCFLTYLKTVATQLTDLRLVMINLGETQVRKSISETPLHVVSHV
jgi:hypothetical protein